MPTTLPSRQTLLRGGLLFAVLFVTAELFSHIYATLTAPALIWPIPGIALAGVLLGGSVLWPAIALAIFVHQSLLGSSFVVAFGLAAANTIQPLAGAWLLKQQPGFAKTFSRVPDTLAFVAVALFITMIVPTLGTLVLALDGNLFPRGVMGTWVPWWIGQMLSVLIMTPLLTRWLYRSFTRTKVEWIEAGSALLSLILVDLFLFWTPYQEFGGVPLVYLILGPLLWFALRIGPRFTTLALFVNAALALGGTAYIALSTGNASMLGEQLFQTEIFIIMISFIFLVLVSIAEERKDTANDLRHNVQNLEKALERIQKEDEAKSRFIATLAHELRNPLAPLMTSLELLSLEKPAPEKTGKIATAMIEHVKTMRHLLDDLLDISRISREKLTLQKEHVDLHGVIAKSVRTIAPIMEEREHAFSIDLPSGAIRFEADPIRLEQIIVNLLNNAAKYTEPGGTITLSAEITDRMLIIRVRDTGIGMDPEMLDRVFEPFFQVEHSGRKISGLGIGLSLTKNLVEMHDGRIYARSEGAGAGSEFMIHLPLHDLVQERVPSITPTEALSAGSPSSRILVIDDNRAAADGLVKLLTLRGHAAEAVYTGEDGLRHAPVYQPDVILLDIGLPDMEGYEVAKRLKADGTVTAAIVALTGYGQESDIRKAEKAGFDHHLTKPAGLSEIEELLRNIAG